MSGASLPPSWREQPLSGVADINPRRQAPIVPPSTPFHFVPMRAVVEEFGGIDVAEMRPFSEVAKGYTQFDTGDVIIAKITPCMENGKIAIVPALSSPCAYGSTEFHVLRPRPSVEAKWIARFLSQESVRREGRANMSGSAGQLRVPRPWLEALPIPVAPLPEQRRIVAKIEELFSDLDAGVAALERVRANLKRYRAAVLKAAVEGRLTKEWRTRHPATEPAAKLLERILAERRAKWEQDQHRKFKEAGKTPPKGWKEKYKQPAGADHGSLHALPDGWTWAIADQLCSQVTDGEHIQPPYQTTGKPMLTATHVRDDGVRFENVGLIAEDAFDKALKRCSPTEGDLLIVSVGATTGRAGVVGPSEPFAIVRSVLLLKPLISSKYLLRWVQSPWCNRWIGGASGATAQAHFYISDAKRMPIPLPPASELSEIVAEVDRRLSVADAAETQVEHALQRAARLRQSILKRAFEGKLVEQDPTDEPATALLQRISNGRVAGPQNGAGKPRRKPPSSELVGAATTPGVRKGRKRG